jgi:hypothetical protein
MKLKAARVTDYKSITDSNAVEFDDRVTCLVGKNESGKTAFLEGLYRWNPIPTGHPDNFVPLRDFPRARYAAEREGVPRMQAVELVLEMEDDDVKALEAEFGKGIIKDRTIRRARSFNNQWTTVVSVDERAFIKARLARAGIPAAVGADAETVAVLVEKLGTLGEEEAAPALAAELTDFEVSEAVLKFIREELGYPRFLYFDEYSGLPGRVSVPRLQQHEADLDSGERTALALLRLAGVATDDFSEEDYEARRAALEAASNQITQEVFEYWSQNKDLLVELDLDFNAPDGPKTGETPPYLEIRIRNLRHGVTLNFGERSAGFVWFFSFLVAFSEYRGKSRDLVLLLDEPGLGLHAAAQADLLRYIEERLAPDHMVLYSTHSPFMVDATRLERVRTVEDVENEGTKVGADVLGTSRDTLFPLQAALGYELAQTLFVGPDNLVVEGPADYLYLSVLSGHLQTLGRAALDPKWVIVPVGGLDKIPTFIALLGAQLNVAVVMDSAAGGSQRINDLIHRGIIESKNVIALNTITGGKEADIEDLFDEAFYLKLLKASGAGTVTKAKLPAGNRIVRRVADVVGDYDHYRPARHLLEHQTELLPEVDDATLDRFEKLFEEINGLLTSR